MNRELLEKLASLERRIGALERQERSVPVVCAYLINPLSPQAIPTGSGGETAIDYAETLFESHPGTMTPAALGGWYWTAPLAGYYLVSASVLFDSTTAFAEHEYVRLRLVKNGSSTEALRLWAGRDFSASASFAQATLVHAVSLAAGNTIDVRVLQISGTQLNIYTTATFSEIAIARIS